MAQILFAVFPQYFGVFFLAHHVVEVDEHLYVVEADGLCQLYALGKGVDDIAVRHPHRLDDDADAVLGGSFAGLTGHLHHLLVGPIHIEALRYPLGTGTAEHDGLHAQSGGALQRFGVIGTDGLLVHVRAGKANPAGEEVVARLAPDAAALHTFAERGEIGVGQLHHFGQRQLNIIIPVLSNSFNNLNTGLIGILGH